MVMEKSETGARSICSQRKKGKEEKECEEEEREKRKLTMFSCSIDLLE